MDLTHQLIPYIAVKRLRNVTDVTWTQVEYPCVNNAWEVSGIDTFYYKTHIYRKYKHRPWEIHRQGGNIFV